MKKFWKDSSAISEGLGTTSHAFICFSQSTNLTGQQLIELLGAAQADFPETDLARVILCDISMIGARGKGLLIPCCGAPKATGYERRDDIKTSIF